MRSYFPIVFSLVSGIILALGAGMLLKNLNKRFWRKAVLNHYHTYVIYLVFAAAILWFSGKLLSWSTILLIGASSLALLNISGLLLILTLSFTFLIDKLFGAASRTRLFKSNNQPVFDPSRRKFIKYSAASLPLLALGTAGTGTANSFQRVHMPQIKFSFSNLDHNLDGLRILHLSDLHLGYYFQLPDLEETLAQAQLLNPHLVLVTGDIADDLSVLGDALNLIKQIKPQIGTYLSLGNHEYYRGIKQVMKIIENGPLPLLKNTGVELDYNNGKIYLAALDDPVSLRSDIYSFLEKSIDETMRDAPENTFKILMSHRPRALDVATNYEIDLVLAGHTHGGQIGIQGRSLFQHIGGKEPYMWGKYKKGNSQLYTSSGMGHWFPFRLNCPPEAPLITIGKAALKKQV